jgi:2-oxoglutarate ferredoxin oxidoreductase subunit delta
LTQISQDKSLVVILEDHCKGCELCVVACPSGNLTLSEKLNKMGFHPAVWRYMGKKGPCTACGICYWVCPDAAIHEVYART